MAIEPLALAAILGMALATYFTRAAGVALMNRVTLSPRVERWLSKLPGAIIVAITAPALARGGVAEWTAAAVTVLVALRLGNLPLALLAGVGLTAGLRALL